MSRQVTSFDLVRDSKTEWPPKMVRIQPIDIDGESYLVEEKVEIRDETNMEKSLPRSSG